MGNVDRAISAPGASATEDEDTQKKRREGCALSVRIDDALYWRLRRFVTGHEVQTGGRVTHQAILEVALAEYLERNATPLC